MSFDSSCKPLLERLKVSSFMGHDSKKLIIVLGGLGDFDSFEYTRILVRNFSRIYDSGIKVFIFAIGNDLTRREFSKFSGFPEDLIEVDLEPFLHRSLALNRGIKTPFGPLVDLIAMCAGIGSPGTLKEVIRGYLGDRNASQCINSDERIEIGGIPLMTGKFFNLAGGTGFLRPFELATLRLRNMFEICSKWNIYVPDITSLTQLGGTFLFDSDDTLLYSYRARGLLGFSETMGEPLIFLQPWLVN